MFYGLNNQVRFREDLGFIFLDDGIRIYKMNAFFFNEIRKGYVGEEAEFIIQSMPTVFRSFIHRETAIKTYVDKEI